MTQDVEKRWRDPRTARAAVRYAAVIVAAALLLMAAVVIWAAVSGDRCADEEFLVCTDPARLVLAIGPTAILLLGAVGAFVQTYRVWRSGGTWPIWHGTGWGLMVLTLVYGSISSGVLVGG
ncbi:hypothetical protein [Rhodococcus aetherivorans]|uniref:hypothetical protein n=1 Tax=Rhodococcus aetherivorans TaxID=191292 RepID=UPI00045D495E|nr:hypothetical protein [Rhodococcus aetherivorans]KDE12020.1 membrane protein [Rhodococcus aetherivorans]